MLSRAMWASGLIDPNVGSAGSEPSENSRIAFSPLEMIILKQVLTLRLIAIFVAVVSAGILATGFLLNAILWRRHGMKIVKVYGPGCNRCERASISISCL